MKRNVKFLIGTLALFLTFFLVLIGCMHQIATDPGETQPYDSPTGTVEIPLNWELFTQVCNMQLTVLGERLEEIKTLVSGGDLEEAERKAKNLLQNATDSEQTIVQLYGNQSIEEFRAVENPVFHKACLEGKIFPVLSKIGTIPNTDGLISFAQTAEWFLPAVIIKDSMIQAHPEWWNETSVSAYSWQSVKNVEKIETLIAQKYKDLSDYYKSLWNMLVERDKPIDAMEQMNAQQEEYLTFLTNYQNYLNYLTRQGKSYADEIYQTKPYAAFAGEFYQKIKEQSKSAEFWGNLQQGDVVCLGTYEQDNNLENGKEPILWAVTYRDGNRVYLRSLYVLEALPWNSKVDPTQSYAEQVRWDNSTIRAWLNGEFYDTAFSREEKNFIVTTDLDNDWEGSDFPPELTYKRGLYSSVGGKDTQDRVYIDASIDYIYSPIWGDSVSSPDLFAPYTGITPYVMAKYGTKIGYYERERGGSPVEDGGWALEMRGAGWIYRDLISKENGVRPCIQIQVPAA